MRLHEKLHAGTCLPRQALLAVALLAATTSAFATRLVDASVRALGSTVSYSTTSETYRIGYEIRISNTGSSTVNNVRFEGTVSIPDGFVASFETADGIACQSPPLNPNVVNCSLGTLSSGAGRTFALFFRSPVNSLDTSTRPATFATATYYAEGTNDNGTPDNDTVIRVDNVVSLGTSLPNEVRSALLPTGGTFATQQGDAFNTRVRVPAQPRYSSVRIAEELSPETTTCSAQRNFVQCYGTNVDVPDVVFLPSDPNFLTFDIVVAGSNVRKGAKIDRVVIRYSAPAEYGVGPVGPLDVQLCARVGNVPVPNDNYEPCIASRAVIKRGTPGWTPQTDGSFRWTILNKKNGRFDLF